MYEDISKFKIATERYFRFPAWNQYYRLEIWIKKGSDIFSEMKVDYQVLIVSKC